VCDALTGGLRLRLMSVVSPGRGGLGVWRANAEASDGLGIMEVVAEISLQQCRAP
jgi:hypothetical protein